ncbi:MAG: hemin uptake protein HemP [Methylococcales bacterium]
MHKDFHDAVETAEPAPSTKQRATQALRPHLNSVELFGDAREVVIDHAGEEYRLKWTRRGKLILTK